jgi:hypothetical protein
MRPVFVRSSMMVDEFGSRLRRKIQTRPLALIS